MKISCKKFKSLVFLLLILTQLNAQVSVLFSKNFSSNSFSTNNWSFPTGQSNWQMGSTNTPSGATAPNAYFNWWPVIYNYSASLLSSVCPKTRCLDGKIQFRSVLKKMIVRFTGVNERLFFLTQRRKWSFRPNTK